MPILPRHPCCYDISCNIISYVLNYHIIIYWRYSDGSVQDCSNSSALAMELLHICTEPCVWQHAVQFEIVFQYRVYRHMNISSGTKTDDVVHLQMHLWTRHCHHHRHTNLQNHHRRCLPDQSWTRQGSCPVHRPKISHIFIQKESRLRLWNMAVQRSYY